MRNNKNNVGKNTVFIILLLIIIVIIFLLCFQYIFLDKVNRDHAYQTGEVLADQVGKILKANDRKQYVLIETLKENYIAKAKAVAYFLDSNPETETDIEKLLHIAELMSIDEIHLFTEEGEIFSGTVPKYYGYSFDSGEQMAFFKPMLSDKTLSMCQDVTPNTAESKSMMYAICWNGDGSRMIQVGIEPVRLLEELHANEISEVVNDLPVNPGMNIIVADVQTGEIEGSTIPGWTGLNLSECGIDAGLPDKGQTSNFTSVLKNSRVYCTAGRTEKYLIFIVQSVKEINSGIPKMMLIVFLYLMLSSCILIFTIGKLTDRILREKRNAYTDAMTGLKNRRAYEEQILYLEDSPKTEFKDLTVMMIDINELKRINDQYGHDGGDKAIKAFAGIIDEILSQYGSIYRIGGDEFAAFLHTDYSMLGQLIGDVESELSKWSEENRINLSMSCGTASSVEFPEKTVEELIKVSDERMYNAKALFYQKSGHDRRLYNKKQIDLYTEN